MAVANVGVGVRSQVWLKAPALTLAACAAATLCVAPVALAQQPAPQPVVLPANSADDFDPALRAALEQAVGDSSSFDHPFDAEVWLLDMSTRLEALLPFPQRRLALLRAVHAEAQRVDLPPELILSLIHVESRFDRFAVSSVGAQGLMQIMPFWVAEIGRPDDDLFDLQTNLRYGTTILKFYIDRENGNLFRGLGAYNGSLGKARYPNLVQRAHANLYYPG